MSHRRPLNNKKRPAHSDPDPAPDHHATSPFPSPSPSKMPRAASPPPPSKQRQQQQQSSPPRSLTPAMDIPLLQQPLSDPLDFSFTAGADGFDADLTSAATATGTGYDHHAFGGSPLSSTASSAIMQLSDDDDDHHGGGHRSPNSMDMDMDVDDADLDDLDHQRPPAYSPLPREIADSDRIVSTDADLSLVLAAMESGKDQPTIDSIEAVWDRAQDCMSSNSGDADDLVTLANGPLALSVPYPFRVWLVAAAGLCAVPGTTLGVADWERARKFVDRALAHDSCNHVQLLGWLALAYELEKEYLAPLIASYLMKQLSESRYSDMKEGRIVRAANLLESNGAVHSVRGVYRTATEAHPTSALLWRAYVEHMELHAKPSEAAAVRSMAENACPSALGPDDTDDELEEDASGVFFDQPGALYSSGTNARTPVSPDSYGKSVTISHNPLLPSSGSTPRGLATSVSDSEYGVSVTISTNPRMALHGFAPKRKESSGTGSSRWKRDQGDDDDDDAPSFQLFDDDAPPIPTTHNVAVNEIGMLHTSRVGAVSSTSTSSSSAARSSYYGGGGYSGYYNTETEPGLRGLQNLGNTCFMNSALQCMSNTPFLTHEYFLSGKWVHEVNADNPLGMQGAMAKAYAALIRALWAPTSRDCAVAPRHFKSIMAQFAPQFSGYQQHDSQELLGFLLDGLHEDLNRVKVKPYVESKDDDGRPDNEVANEQWDAHRSRNDSIVVDMFQGQYKSRVQCATCSNISVTFDPFMVLALPIPATTPPARFVITAVPLAPLLPSRHVVWMRKEAGVSELKRVVARDVFGDETKRTVAFEVFNRKPFKVFVGYEPLADLHVTSDDELWVAELPADDGAAPPGVPSADEVMATIAAAQEADDVEDDKADEDSAADTKDSGPEPMHVDIVKSAPSSQLSSTIKTERPTYVPVLVGHRKSSRPLDELDQQASTSRYTSYSYGYSMYARGEEFGQPVIAYIQVPVVPIQALAAVAAATAQWTSFPWAQFRAANPDHSDLAGFLRIENKYSKQLVAGAKLQPLTELTATWDPRAYEIVFATKPAPPLTSGFPPIPVVGAGRSPSPMDTDSASAAAAAAPSAALGAATADSGLATTTRTGSETETDELASASTDDDAMVFAGYERWSRINSGAVVNQALAPPAVTSQRSSSTDYSLDQCFDAFVAEERLDPTETVYCRKCKEHREATKKVDLWRAPPTLVVALKRFGQGGRYRREKIGAMVDCPLVLDLSERVLGPRRNNPAPAGDGDVEDESMLYDLYAVTNHFGGLGGGHYTAYAQSPTTGKWYDFDDSRVTETDAARVVSPASYVLFYRRRGDHSVTVPEPLTLVADAQAESMMSQDPEAVVYSSRFSSGGMGGGGAYSSIYGSSSVSSLLGNDAFSNSSIMSSSSKAVVSFIGPSLPSPSQRDASASVSAAAPNQLPLPASQSQSPVDATNPPVLPFSRTGRALNGDIVMPATSSTSPATTAAAESGPVVDMEMMD